MYGCTKADPEPEFTLPPISAVGANTLGFEVDGRVWVNYGQRCFLLSGCFDNKIQVDYGSCNGVRCLYIWTGYTVRGTRDEGFSLRIDTVRGPGIYTAGTRPVNLPPSTIIYTPNGLTFSDELNSIEYVSLTQNSTRIVLTKLDTVNHIISGTFEGRLSNSLKPNNYVTITNGRFNVTYTD
ncbi:hypothetical protein GCM10011375_36780 [Hymenobacter qilianensis]|uniref:Uncharacterized protein n=2 Tax=Hymenobacter qilianensis TaxID=1385715 RepID=A0A7H0GS39_9BACT|nr:hypothetical protein [Hymenobacter qilianensis]QNP51105.1 hypothetical protein H9L05_13405 [Hymenobacter qilianensis]GGF78326.1 hypothetical protein GCM10011375_36780 [Hymenobacter qilianensis]